MSKKLGLFIMLLMVAGAGCASNLGECKEPWDLESEDGRYAYKGDINGDGVPQRVEYAWPGQQVVNTSCAGGRCHSELATGEARQGAPAGLNFDAPITGATSSTTAIASRGIAVIRDNADSMWDELNEGTMPPSDAAPDHEAVRNWLACGAPATAPEVIQPSGASYNDVYAGLQSACASCHVAAKQGLFSLGTDVCESYAIVTGQPSVAAGVCGGRSYVVANDPGNSLLLQKMTGAPGCGSPMPLGQMPYQDQAPAVFNAVQQWILAGALPPSGCP